MVTTSDTSHDDTLLTLSELVEATGVPASTIHHYLKCELIPPPTRSALNRFGYDERHVTTLVLIRGLRERKGLGLDEIAAQLPALLDHPEAVAALAEDPEREAGVAVRIVDAAITAFRTRSFGEVTMAEVAEAAGVSKGRVYRYFGSKEDLFTAAMERVLDRTAEKFAGAVERLGGPAGVTSVSEGSAEEFAALAADTLPMLLELGARAAKGNLASEELARRVLRTLAATVGQRLVADTGGNPVDAGLAVIQTAFSLMLQWAVGTDWPPDELLPSGGGAGAPPAR